MSDFSDIVDQGVTFTPFELGTGVDFVESGDSRLIILKSIFGEGPYGEGPYGGDEYITINYSITDWTNIDTP